MAIDPIRIPTLSQTVPFVDSDRRLSNEGLRRLNEAFRVIQESVNAVIAAQATADQALAQSEVSGFDRTEPVSAGTTVMSNVLVEAGATISVAAKVAIGPAAGTGTATFESSYSIAGAGLWTVLDTDSQNYGPSDPLYINLNPPSTFTNSSGFDQLYDIRVVLSGEGGPVDDTRSYLRAYY